MPTSSQWLLIWKSILKTLQVNTFKGRVAAESSNYCCPPTFVEFTGSHTSSRRFCVCAMLTVDRPRDPTKRSPHHEYPLSKIYANTCQIFTGRYRSLSLFLVNFSAMTLKSAFTSELLSTFSTVVHLLFVLFTFLHVSVCVHFGICPSGLLTLLERRTRTFIVICQVDAQLANPIEQLRT